jgi:hypothetical protein
MHRQDAPQRSSPLARHETRVGGKGRARWGPEESAGRSRGSFCNLRILNEKDLNRSSRFQHVCQTTRQAHSKCVHSATGDVMESGCSLKRIQTSK